MNKKILIVNVNWVGDVIFSTPFIRTVREAYPDAHIACLLHPRCREMLETNKRLDEIIIYDEDGLHKNLIGKMRLVSELRKKRFDSAFLLHRSFTKALLAYFAGIAERIGYATKRRDRILTKAIEEPDEALHKVEYFLHIARAAGLEPSDVSYEFFVEDVDRESVKALLEKYGIGGKERFVVLCPGGNWAPKRWPKENFAALGDLIAERAKARIVISGAAKDIALAEEIKALMRSRPVVTAGRTDLRQLGALLESSSLVIANDSGPMHIAVAMRAKTISLFGPTSPAITGPYGSGNYRVIQNNTECDVPCYDMDCKAYSCMERIKVADVLREAMEMMETGYGNR